MRRSRNDQEVSELTDEVARAFGEKLLAARERSGLTQEELGYRSSVNRGEVGQLELGHHVPRLDTLLKLAGGLDVDPCQLLGDLRWRPPPEGPAKGGLYKP
jgi:transcriptional regulator with XRE-family HTH domain